MNLRDDTYFCVRVFLSGYFLFGIYLRTRGIVTARRNFSDSEEGSVVTEFLWMNLRSVSYRYVCPGLVLFLGSLFRSCP